MITLKVTKNLGFTHSLEDTFFEKKNISGKGGGGGGPFPSPKWPPTPFSRFSVKGALYSVIFKSALVYLYSLPPKMYITETLQKTK